MRRVTVLGGTGFIGHHIVNKLIENGDHVTVLARPTSDKRSLEDIDNVEIIDGDIENVLDLEKAFKDADSVIHSAAYYPIYSLDRDRQVAEGLLQIRQIHKALEASKVKRFI